MHKVVIDNTNKTMGASKGTPNLAEGTPNLTKGTPGKLANIISLPKMFLRQLYLNLCLLSIQHLNAVSYHLVFRYRREQQEIRWTQKKLKNLVNHIEGIMIIWLAIFGFYFWVDDAFAPLFKNFQCKSWMTLIQWIEKKIGP